MANSMKVTNGPSKLDLMLALFDSHPHGQCRMVTFTAEGEPFGSLEFSFSPQVVSRTCSLEDWEVIGIDYKVGVERGVKLRITFSTKTRQGYLSIDDDYDASSLLQALTDKG